MTVLHSVFNISPTRKASYGTFWPSDTPLFSTTAPPFGPLRKGMDEQLVLCQDRMEMRSLISKWWIPLAGAGAVLLMKILFDRAEAITRKKKSQKRP